MTENEAIKLGKSLYNNITCNANNIIPTKEYIEFVGIAIQALEEIQQHRAIGTIEEFKALKEKATPKKLEVEKFWGYDDLMCPNCKSYKIRNPKYCCDCGQALDWQ